MISTVIEKEQIENDYINIVNKNDINHLKNVFRVKIGDKIRVVDGEKEYFCKVFSFEKEKMVLLIECQYEDKYTPKVTLDMGVCIVKNDKMDLIIQKLTEIGVNEIIPIESKRVIIKIDGKEGKKIEKWKIVSKEALKQCQGVKNVEINSVKTLFEIDYGIYDLILIPYELEEGIYLKDIWKNIAKKPEKILVIIGPEGGFEEEEIKFLKSKGGKTISLGKRILRTETSAIIVGGIIINEFM
ncbi:RsmE family RNA methyltransferase [Fusobacterium sp. PH5-44]|uniref:RsmE family RNA methyltransferase n=1 Tax=unclassified Fusobacterium TaxID=2648384 RepID=UPI003D1AD532